MNRLTLLLAGIVAAFLVAGTACAGGGASSGEEPTPARTERVRLASPQPTREPTPKPTPAPPLGWTRHITPEFEIDLPDSWETWDPTKESDEAIVQALQTVDAKLAEALQQQLVDPEAPGQTFAAFDTQSGEFLTNFGVFQQDSPVPMTVRGTISQSEAQVSNLGFTLLSSDAELSIGGVRAGRIEYAVSCACGFEARELDYFVLPEPTRGFQLTFAASADEYPTLKPIFERIAESVRVLEDDGA